MLRKKYATITIIFVLLALTISSYATYFELRERSEILHDNDYRVVMDYEFYYFVFDAVLKQENLENIHVCEYVQEALSGGDGKNYFKQSFPYGCYLYPPHFAVIFSMFSLLPYYTSEFVFNSAVNLLYVLGILLFLKLLLRSKTNIKGKQKTIMVIFALLLAISNIPFIIDTFYINVNRLIFFLLSLTFYLHYYKKKSKLAGFVLGLAIVLKVTPAILLVYYMCKKKWGIVIGAVISGIITTVLTYAVVGYQSMFNFISRDFWQNSSAISNHHHAPENSSLKGVLNYFLPNFDNSILFYVYCIVMFFLILWLFLKTNNMEKEIALLSFSPLLFTPHLETNHMVMSLFLILILFKNIYEDKIDKKYENSLTVLLFVSVVILFTKPISFEYFLSFIGLTLCLLIFVKKTKNT